MNILEEANNLIHGDREKVYGHPWDDFSRTATMWSVILSKILLPGKEISPFHVALMMTCLKLSRLVASPLHRDSIVDAAGYLGCGERVLDREVELKGQSKC